MQFLRTVFWVVLAVLGVIFALNNWTPVRVKLWSDIVVDTWLPALMLVTFLLGLLPMFLLHRASRWSLKRRLDSTQRQLAETQAQRDATPPPPMVTATVVPPGAL